MAETITGPEWQALGMLTPAQLREVVYKQLQLTEQALQATKNPPEPLRTLVGQAFQGLSRGDTISEPDKRRSAYNAAYSQARWALDELGVPLRAVGKGALFEQLTAAARGLVSATAATRAAPSAPPPPLPAQPPGSAPPGTSPAKPGGTPRTRLGQVQQEQILKLAALEPAELRRLAVQQRDQIAKKLADSRGFIGDLLQRWPQYDRELVNIDAMIKAGDEIAVADADTRRTKAVRYAGALMEAQRVALDLDRDIASGSTAALYLGDVLDVAEKAATEAGRVAAETAKDVKDAAGRAAKGAGETLQTGTYLLFGAVALALGAAVYSRVGASPARRRGSDLF